MFRCESCSQRFKSRGQCDRHLNTKHQKELSLVRNLRAQATNNNYNLEETVGDIIDVVHDFQEPEPGNHVTPSRTTPSRTTPITATVNVFEDAGHVFEDLTDSLVLPYRSNPWTPFISEKDYKIARFMIEEDVAMKSVDRYFNSGAGGKKEEAPKGSLTSSWILKKLMDGMPENIGLDFESAELDYEIPNYPKIPYYYRDPIKCVSYLLSQPAYGKHLIFKPIQQFDQSGNRCYSEMHTAEWWWNIQKDSPRLSTVAPVLCSSDETHLSKFLGDRKAWPVYITIGNLPASIRNAPSYHAILLLALLPIPPKKAGLSLEKQRTIIPKIQEVLKKILQPLSEAKLLQEGIKITCGDGKLRWIFPRLAGWSADYNEYLNLLGFKKNYCPRCEIDSTELEEYLPKAKPRDYRKYVDRLKSFESIQNPKERKKKIDRYLTVKGLKEPRTALATLEGVLINDLHKPDLLHGIYLGLTVYMLDWCVDFLKLHARLEKFDAMWTNLPQYPDFAPFTTSWSLTQQYTGKSMRMANKVLLGLFTVALGRAKNVDERRNFPKAIAFVRSYLEFVLMAQYPSHNTATIGYMMGFWKDFHSHKEIFRCFRPRRAKVPKRRTKASTTRFAHDIAFDTDESGSSTEFDSDGLATNGNSESNDESSEDNNEDDDHFSNPTTTVTTRHKIQDVQNKDFNIPKIHLPSHYPNHIKLFGDIQSFSTDPDELQHIQQVKKGWESSNKSKEPFPQVIAFYNRKRCFRMRELNILALVDSELMSALDVSKVFLGLYSNEERLAIQKENRTGIVQQLPEEKNDGSVLDNGDELFKDSTRTNRRLWGLIKLDKVPTKITIKRMGILFDLPDLTQAFCKYVKQQWTLFTNIGRGALLSVRPEDTETFIGSLFSRADVPLPNFQDKSKFDLQTIVSKGNQTWFQKNSRRDFIYYQKGEESQYGNLRGLGVARVECFFAYTDSMLQKIERVAFITDWGVLHNGWCQDPHGFIILQQKPREDYSERLYPERKIISIESILGAAHLIHDPDTRKDYLNTHMELNWYSEIYKGNTGGYEP